MDSSAGAEGGGGVLVKIFVNPPKYLFRIIRNLNKVVIMYIGLLVITITLVVLLCVFRLSLTNTQLGIILSGYSVIALLFPLVKITLLSRLQRQYAVSAMFESWFAISGFDKAQKHLHKNNRKYEKTFDIIPFIIPVLSIIASTVYLFVGTK